MRKVVLILLCFTMFFAAVSCQRTNAELTQQQSGGEINIPAGSASQTLDSTIESNSEVLNSPTEVVVSESIISPIYISALYKETDTGKQYLYFTDSVQQNTYDQWLLSKLSDESQSEEAIYREYLNLWKNELTFTVENGKEHFSKGDKFTFEQYEHWKNYIEQWILSAENLLESQIQILTHAEMSSVGVLIAHSTLVRQMVINTKEFLYRLEIIAKSLEPNEYRNVSVDWAPKAESLGINATQNNGASKTTDNKVSNRNATDLICLFYDRVDPSSYDILLKTELLELDEEDTKLLKKIRDIYADYLSFWEDHEIPFTMDKIIALSKDSPQYIQLKTALEQLLISTQNLSNNESSILITRDAMSVIPRCELMRQTVLNLKFLFFYFDYQKNVTNNVDPREIIIEWSIKG